MRGGIIFDKFSKKPRVFADFQAVSEGTFFSGKFIEEISGQMAVFKSVYEGTFSQNALLNKFRGFSAFCNV